MGILLLTRPQAPELFEGPLRDALPDVDIWTESDQAADERVTAILAWRLKPGTAARYPNLRLVCATAAGVEKLTDDPGLDANVQVMRIVDPLVNVGIAQYVLLMALRHVRALPLYAQQQREHAWIRHRAADPYAITAGILGLGEAGRVVARLLHGAGFNLVGWSRTPKALRDVECYAGEDGLQGCLARADVLVCALPLTASTHGLLARRTLSQLPAGAYVINVARGGHLVEADLLALIDSGHLAGAALDVQETEPLPIDSPLWDHPKIVVTPHIAAQAGIAAIVAQFAANWRRMESGQSLANVIDRSLGY